MESSNLFSFSIAVRGFHVIEMSEDRIGEQHACVHVENNPYDIFATKVCETGWRR